ncbi:MAG: A/G-specific adenine glycosylase [Haliscomenobacteraceae bacterium CHB4]|nr:A/G-specific adenine glycosylase [Haliscomenobacteraceae bacterium CHB4]
MGNKQFFQEHLFSWFARHQRPLPWKGEDDPYKIWLSEIILQQTRVEQGLPYYQKFVAKYPDIKALAAAPEDEVLKLWEGLGYYSRARNLRATAKFIAGERNGKFPDTYETIRALKGVGDYTAAAIASFAFNLPHAVLDGNVFRVLARYFGIETPTDTPAAKKEFASLAQELLDPARPGEFNQALMDFGATHCTPSQPKCPACPMQPHCVAFRQKKVALLPVKSKTLEKKDRYFVYLVAYFQGSTFVRKRTGKDIWQNLWEFPLLELPEFPADNRDLELLMRKEFHPSQAVSEIRYSKPYRQTLTHRLVTAVFCEIFFPDDTPAEVFERQPFAGCQRVTRAELKKNIAVPRIIDRFLQERALTLTLI